MPRRRSCWHVLFAVWAWYPPALSAAPASARKPATASARSSLTAQYRQAMAHYRAGRPTEAAQIFAAILRRHPEHEPSRVYLAKCFFRLEMLEEAYQQFRTVNPRTLDPETSYEYAHTFYEKEQFEEALATFSQVPDGHGLFDLASFYGAISALKLKRYKDAEILIGKAVVLPSRLVRTRNLYRQHIQQLVLKEEEEQLTREKAAEEKRLRDQTRVFREKLAEDEQAPSAPPSLIVPARHEGFFSNPQGAEVGFVNKRQLVDFSRIETEDNTLHTNFFHFRKGHTSLSQKRDRKPDAAWGFGLGFKVEDRNYNGSERIIDPSPEDVTKGLVLTGGTNGNQKIGSGSGQLWYEKGLGGSSWSGVKLSWLGVYPDFKSGTSRTNRALEWSIGKKTDRSSYQLILDGIQALDFKGKPFLVTQEQHIEGTWSIPSGFGALAAVRAQQLTYPDNTFRLGPEKTGRFKAQVFSDFPIGVRVGLEGSIQSSQGYRTPVLPDLEFSEQNLAAIAFIHVQPLEWLDIHITGGREQRHAKDIKQLTGAPLSPDVNAYSVKEKHYDFISENGVTISANLLF